MYNTRLFGLFGLSKCSNILNELKPSSGSLHFTAYNVIQCEAKKVPNCDMYSLRRSNLNVWVVFV